MRQKREKLDKLSNKFLIGLGSSFFLCFPYILMSNGVDYSVPLGIFGIILVTILIVCGLGFAYTSQQIKEIDSQISEENQKKVVARQKLLRETYDDLLFKLAGNHERITAESLVMWFSSQNLYLTSDFGSFQRDANMSSSPDIDAPTFLPHKVIKINDIQYFTKEGDVQYTTKISGGGGGGSSIGGAIIGGAIAGDAGAIIGSRKKVDSIKSTTVKHDDRKTILRFYDKGAIKTLTWARDDVYNFFLQYIPEKDLLTMQINSQPQPAKESHQPAAAPAKPSGISARLEELANLYKAGLIDDTEYKQMKAKVLEQYT